MSKPQGLARWKAIWEDATGERIDNYCATETLLDILAAHAKTFRRIHHIPAERKLTGAQYEQFLAYFDEQIQHKYGSAGAPE